MQRFRSTLELASTTTGSVTTLTHWIRMTSDELQVFRSTGADRVIVVTAVRELEGTVVKGQPEQQSDGTYLLSVTTGI